MSARPAVTAIVPARNEGARIEATVRALLAIPAIDDVLVVDDASTDDTLARASAAGARVHRLARRRGKGGALTHGVGQTTSEVLVFIDADVQHAAAVAAPLLEPVIASAADMTIAAPPPSAPSGFGLVERFARWGIRRLTGRTMHRPLSGQRALRREIPERFGLARRFGIETALTVDALRAGYRVTEVTCEVTHAKTGRNVRGFLHRARQALDVARALASRMRNRPS